MKNNNIDINEELFILNEMPKAPSETKGTESQISEKKLVDSELSALNQLLERNYFDMGYKDGFEHADIAFKYLAQNRIASEFRLSLERYVQTLQKEVDRISLSLNESLEKEMPALYEKWKVYSLQIQEKQVIAKTYIQESYAFGGLLERPVTEYNYGFAKGLDAFGQSNFFNPLPSLL